MRTVLAVMVIIVDAPAGRRTVAQSSGPQFALKGHRHEIPGQSDSGVAAGSATLRTLALDSTNGSRWHRNLFLPIGGDGAAAGR
ncbi:MAG: hypothetical protein KatS3mg111_2045 [Pirellulaceae bacterium]|nr:MAG: hypothetical protein KatS3mg111_2045 [Pirellulaceae bacterium]